ncbi:MAG: thioesterase family protein [Betaproteobacteria bacterium]|nr:thioesterase family protein [Betaproteobacteria bacterium]
MRRNAIEQEKFERALRAMFEKEIRFNDVLGLCVEQLGAGTAVIGFAMQPQLVGHFQHGRLHGGVISAALDATAGCAVMMGIADRHPHDSADQTLARFTRVGTIDLRVDYLRQGLGQRFSSSARVTRIGGRIASTQMELHNDGGLLIATGAASYIVS